jgi:alkanesulfonate monooxygenase SsuD/methylene tetrahydromethanopterin reductase-like flavin-dependent oxidoreductase (luciferase family)
MDTNFCYGQIPALTRDKYREAHELIMRAWRSDEIFSFDGKYTQLRYVNIWPRPLQKPHPPIFIPGGGSVETWDFCIDNDYNYSYLSFFGYVRAKQLMDSYWEQVAKRGKDESPYRGGFAQTIVVAETDQEAEKLFSEHIRYFYNRCLHMYPGFLDPPGYRTIKTLKAEAVKGMAPDAIAKLSDLSWKQLLDDRYVIAGSPETVRQQMEELIKGLHVGHVFCLFHTGSTPNELTRHSSRLFSERVMPKLRNMWPEWKDDTRWWIKPMAERVRPETNLPATEAVR